MWLLFEYVVLFLYLMACLGICFFVLFLKFYNHMGRGTCGYGFVPCTLLARKEEIALTIPLVVPLPDFWASVFAACGCLVPTPWRYLLFFAAIFCCTEEGIVAVWSVKERRDYRDDALPLIAAVAASLVTAWCIGGPRPCLGLVGAATGTWLVISQPALGARLEGLGAIAQRVSASEITLSLRCSTVGLGALVVLCMLHQVVALRGDLAFCLMLAALVYVDLDLVSSVRRYLEEGRFFPNSHLAVVSAASGGALSCAVVGGEVFVVAEIFAALLGFVYLIMRRLG